MGTHSVSVNQVELVPAAEALKALPEEVDLNHHFVVLIDKENPTLGGFFKGTVRFPLCWSDGKTTGEGYVELVPLSRLTTQMEIELSRPRGGHSFLWSPDKLRKKAARVALAIRSEFESRPTGEGAREAAGRRKIRIGAILPAGKT